MMHLVSQQVPEEGTGRRKNHFVGSDPIVVLAHQGNIAELIVPHFRSGYCCEVLKLIKLQEFSCGHFRLLPVLCCLLIT